MTEVYSVLMYCVKPGLYSDFIAAAAELVRMGGLSVSPKYAYQ